MKAKREASRSLPSTRKLMDDTQYCDCWRVERRATCTYDLACGGGGVKTKTEKWRSGRQRDERKRGSVLSLDPRGSRLTDWKQAETFMAAVSHAAINPLSGLFIAKRQREILICVKIVHGDRVRSDVVYDPPSATVFVHLRDNSEEQRIGR